MIGLGGWTGVHLWVEKVELAGVKAGEGDDDETRWLEDAEGWSGGHLGGGTDPRLGPFARSAIRGAWASQHWGGGALAGPVSSSVGSSPFSAGGAMIGSRMADEGREVGDAGWQLAERYLVYALNKAEQKGISLAFAPGTSPTGASQGVDRTAVELEERLAGLRERIGGRYKLEQAREGWERIYYATAASSSPAAWEKREQIRASKKLGDISARLMGFWNEGSEERKMESAKAEGWFLSGLLPVLSFDNLEGLKDTTSTSKSVSPSSGFFGFWSRSHPPSYSTSSSKLSTRPEINTLLSLLHHHTNSPSSFDQATSRLVLNSLISLETFLARDRSLSAAKSVQSASLSFAQSLSHHQASISPSSPIVPASLSLDLKQPSSSLYKLYLATRTSLLSTHLAEVSLATGSQGEPEALLLFQGAISDCEKVISLLESSPLVPPISTLAKLNGNSIDDRNKKSYGRASRRILQDARLTGAMAARLTAFVHETGVRKGKRAPSWCGGDASAETFYAKAMELAGKDGAEGVDEKGFKESEAGYLRAKARVLQAEKGSLK